MGSMGFDFRVWFGLARGWLDHFPCLLWVSGGRLLVRLSDRVVIGLEPRVYRGFTLLLYYLEVSFSDENVPFRM